MKNLFKKNTLLKLFLCAVIAASAISCTDDSPVEPGKESENIIYYFTSFQNPVTREHETHFCKMDEDGSNRTSITQLPYGHGYSDVKYAANMKRLMLGGYSVMDIDGKNRTYLIGGHAEQSYEEISPNGDRFFQMYHGICWLFDAAANWKKKEIFREGDFAKWLYDSKWIIYNSNGNIVSRNADSAAERKTIYYKPDSIQITGYAGEIFPSPYEDKILFSRYAITGEGIEFCVMNSDGSDLRVIYANSSGNYRYYISQWARDGKSVLVYKAEDQYHSHIYLLKLDGSGMQQITQQPVRLGFRSLDFSPDDSKIVFSQFISDSAKGNSGSYVLTTMNTDGTGEKTLTPKGYSDTAPAWVKR